MYNVNLANIYLLKREHNCKTKLTSLQHTVIAIKFTNLYRGMYDCKEGLEVSHFFTCLPMVLG
jgi:hypothetical protein